MALEPVVGQLYRVGDSGVLVYLGVSERDAEVGGEWDLGEGDHMVILRWGEEDWHCDAFDDITSWREWKP